MKNQNVAEKYLTQKKTSPLEIVFAVITAIGAVLFLMHWRYYGVPALAIGVAGLVFTMSAKIKDAEFDQLINKILIDNKIEIQKENVLASFEPDKEPRVIGKDKTIRTSKYYIAELTYKDTECLINLHELDLCAMTVDTKVFKLPYSAQVKLIESEMMTAIGRKRIYHIEAQEYSLRFPVETVSMDVDDFIAHFSK